MTADVEMLPCPWCGEKLASVSVSEGSTSRWRKVDGCCADGPEVRHNTMAEDQEAAEVESRAAAIAAWNTRANVAHATAAKDAEVEALRELCGMAYQLAGVHDAPEKWLDALSNAAAGRPFSTDGLLPYWPQAVCESEARADKLRAEVERANGWNERVSVCRDHVADIVDGPCVICALGAAEARAERLAEALREAQPFIGWTGSYPELHAKIDALLREQEEWK